MQRAPHRGQQRAGLARSGPDSCPAKRLHFPGATATPAWTSGQLPAYPTSSHSFRSRPFVVDPCAFFLSPSNPLHSLPRPVGVPGPSLPPPALRPRPSTLCAAAARCPQLRRTPTGPDRGGAPTVCGRWRGGAARAGALQPEFATREARPASAALSRALRPGPE